MKRGQGRITTTRMLIPLEIHGQSAFQGLLGTHAIDRLLHLAVTSVATLDRVRGRREQFVVQERQGFLQVVRIELVQTLAKIPKPSNTNPQLRQLRQRRIRAAPAIKEAIDLVHDRAQGS